MPIQHLNISESGLQSVFSGRVDVFFVDMISPSSNPRFVLPPVHLVVCGITDLAVFLVAFGDATCGEVAISADITVRTRGTSDESMCNICYIYW